MNMKSIIVIALVALFPAAVTCAETPNDSEKALKAAEAKLDCCCKEVSKRPWANPGLKASQEAWVKCRDLAAAFEMEATPHNDGNKKQVYASIVLRLTRERIEEINRIPCAIRQRFGSAMRPM